MVVLLPPADCFHHFTTPEQLAADEWAYCSRCAAVTTTTRQLLVERLPRVLCVHLKRFNWALRTGYGADVVVRDCVACHLTTPCRRRKVRTPVEFPLEGLDMAPYMCSTSDRATASVASDHHENGVADAASGTPAEAGARAGAGVGAGAGGSASDVSAPDEAGSDGRVTPPPSTGAANGIHVTPIGTVQHIQHSGTTTYDLSGVVVHRGTSAGSGHYYSFCRVDSDLPGHDDDAAAPAAVRRLPHVWTRAAARQQQAWLDTPTAPPPTGWRLCNDSSVRVARPETVAAAEGYILLYTARGPA